MKYYLKFFLAFIFTTQSTGFVMASIIWGETSWNLSSSNAQCPATYSINITWKTTTEITNDKFLLNRSTQPNANYWTNSWTINSCGTCAFHTYNFTDYGPFVEGVTYYYTLILITNSGKIEYKNDFAVVTIPIPISRDWKYQGNNSYVEIASTGNNPNSYNWFEESNGTQGVHINVLPFEIKRIYLQQNNAIINFTTRSNNTSGATYIDKVEVNINNQGYSTIYDDEKRTDIVWYNAKYTFNTLGHQNLKIKVRNSISGVTFYREYNIFVVPASQKLFKDNYCNTLRLWSGTNPANEIPVILTEGFDSYNTRTEEHYRYAGDHLVNCLNEKGFKVYILNYKYNPQDIRNNAAVYASAVRYVSSINNNMQVIAAGISMGGVISRYALAKAENDGIPLPVSKWISIDAPQQGAYIPSDFQDFHKKMTQDDAFAAHASNNDAAKELLTYNSFDPGGTMHNSFYSELNNLNGNGYPHLTKNIGVSFSNNQPNNVNGTWLRISCNNNCPSFLNWQTDLPKFFTLQAQDKVAGSLLPKIEIEPIGIEQSGWGGAIQLLYFGNQEIVFTTVGDNYPTFIPHVSSLDIVNGQSKFDIQIVPSVTSYHDVVPEDIIQPLINELISDNIYLQNKTITDTKYYLAKSTIFAGKNVTTLLPVGNFQISNGANVIMQSENEIIFSDGFISEGELYAFIAPVNVDCGDGIIISQKRQINPDSSEIIKENLEKNNITAENDIGSIKILPNPFNEIINIYFSIAKESAVNISIYNITGQKMKELVSINQHMQGNYTTTFDAQKLSAGVYYIHIFANEKSETLKVVKMK